MTGQARGLRPPPCNQPLPFLVALNAYTRQDEQVRLLQQRLDSLQSPSAAQCHIVSI